MQFQSVEIAGEHLKLLPEKLIFWAKTRTLLVADIHFGKASTFRQAGIPVPNGTTATMLHRLSDVINRHGAQRLVILGDMVHSSTRCRQGFEAELIAWRTSHPNLELVLVRGNHDRGHTHLFTTLDLLVVREPFVEPPFAYCHFHTVNCDASLHRLAGHVHPAIQIDEGRHSSPKFPCFWISDKFTLLPSFGEFTGCSIIRPGPGDQVFVVSDDEVSDVTSIVVKQNDSR